jgi:fluoride exporter
VPESTGTREQPLHQHHGPGSLVAIAVGGALGTLARYGVERAVATPSDGFPWGTLTVNVVGSFLLGVVVIFVVERWPRDRYLRPLLAVGFCGGFTTFSTLAVEVDQRIQHGHGLVAASYLLATLIVGLGAALAGMTVARGRLLPAVGAASVDPDLLAEDERDDGRGNGGAVP